MMGELAEFLVEFNLTSVYQMLVWASALLSVGWISVMTHDPANRHVRGWQLRLRRISIVTIEAGLLTSVLFGDYFKWGPWPPMTLVVLGLDTYYASSIMAAWQRGRVCSVCPFLATREASTVARESPGLAIRFW